MPDEPIVIGRITAAHGIRGEVKVEPLTDFSERFERGSKLWLEGAERVVERGRWQGRSVILKLTGIDTRNDAEASRGQLLTVPELAELDEEGAFYIHDLIGLRVEDRLGTELGRLHEVITTGATDVYVIRGARGELLLPALDDVVTKVDLQGQRIIAEVPEGLDFQKPSPPAGTRRRARPKPRG
jgi:16S rRNA processing protein RimM